MNFSSEFKTKYWWTLFIVLSLVCLVRLNNFSASPIDPYIFFFWFIIAIFPLVSEVSAFGINLKKDFQTFKEEIKTELVNIKNNISNTNNAASTVNFNFAPASPYEIDQKQNEEALENEKTLKQSKIHSEEPAFLRKNVSINQSYRDQKQNSINPKVAERQRLISSVEEMVNKLLVSRYDSNYRNQMKIENTISEKSIVADGILFNGEKINEIIEIKLITNKTYHSFYFVASRFLEKLKSIGIMHPVRFIVVSEDMDQEGYKILQNEINKIGFAKGLGADIFKPKLDCFKLEGNALIPIHENR
jgi:hypothetical protein